MGCLLWVSGRVDHVIMVSRCTCHHRFIVCAHKSEKICSTICTIYLSGRYFPTIHLCIGISKWKHYKIWFKMPNIYSIGGISHRRNMWKIAKFMFRHNISKWNRRNWFAREMCRLWNMPRAQSTKMPSFSLSEMWNAQDLLVQTGKGSQAKTPGKFYSAKSS